MSVRNSAASSITSVFGAVATTATTVTTTVDSLNHLATAGNIKARYYAKAVEDNCESLDRLNRAAAKHRNAKALTDLKLEIAKAMQDATYAALYQESLEELSA